MVLSLKHTRPTTVLLKRLGRFGRDREQICSVCSAALEAFGTARSTSKRYVQCSFSAERVRQEATVSSDKGSWPLVWWGPLETSNLAGNSTESVLSTLVGVNVSVCLLLDRVNMVSSQPRKMQSGNYK